jgi:hypothetical protein
LQGWFPTGHEYKYRLSIGYDFMSALKQAIILGLFLKQIMIIGMALRQANIIMLAV